MPAVMKIANSNLKITSRTSNMLGSVILSIKIDSSLIKTDLVHRMSYQIILYIVTIKSCFQKHLEIDIFDQIDPSNDLLIMFNL